MQVIWEEEALEDLRHIRRHIARDNREAARQVAARIIQAANVLVDQPEIGRPGRVVGTRELVITGTPYLAPYGVIGDAVLILRVLHGAQRWPERF